MNDPNISVLLVDDHAVVREGYRRLLERAGDITVIGEAADAAQALAGFDALAPQVARCSSAPTAAAATTAWP